MARMRIEAIDEYELQLSKLGDKSEEVAKRAVYNGADVVADAIKEALKGLPIEEGENGLAPYKKEGEMLTGVTRKQRQDLIDSMGLAPIQEFKAGYIDTKVGWDGYGSVKTKDYPNGLPNQLLMRSVESGTSFRKKTPVVRRAVTRVKQQAIEKMNKTIDEEIEKII